MEPNSAYYPRIVAQCAANVALVKQRHFKHTKIT